MPQATNNASAQSTSVAPSRRDFVKTSAAVAGAAVLAAGAIPLSVHAAEDNTLKIGLVGCGGRGSGAALQALHADPNTRLVALADMFKDKLDSSLSNLKQSDAGARVDVPAARQFTGWDGYKGVIQNCDVVLLATPPFFRPMHLGAVIDAGKHCFCEKPVATDMPSLHKVMEISKRAKEKNVSLVSGLCYRYDDAKIDTMKRIHGGEVGQIISVQSNYLTGGLWSNARKEGWSDMEWQLRNWLYFTWLSGDMIVEQHIHSLDKVMWIMGDEPPLKVTANGGRTVRTQPEYGNIYDHFNTVYEWKNGVRAFCQARQWVNCDTDVSDWVYGTDGVANVMQHQITGKNAWRRKPGLNMYDLEHIALFKSIRTNEPINNGDYMVKSTAMAIMGRMSAYTGKTILWDKAIASTESLAPEKLEFGPIPVPPIAVPGKTKLA